MFGSSTTTVTLSALLSLAAVQLVHADPTPSEPAPGEVFTEGQTCHIAWSADTTGEWKSMDIELMTGPNDNMVHLTSASFDSLDLPTIVSYSNHLCLHCQTAVANVDATGDTTTFDYTCPTVSLHSAVYFYQFTSPSSSNISWTGRFTITDSTGTTVDPPNSTVIDGSTIEWGTGALTNSSQYTALPTYVTDATVAIETASGDATSAATSAATSSAAATSATVSATSSKKVTATSTASGDAAAATASKSSTNNTSSESTSGAVEGHKVQMALGMVAVLGSIAAFF